MADAHSSGRRLIMHPAHKTIGVSAGPAALRTCELDGAASVEGRPRPLRVCLLCGTATYSAAYGATYAADEWLAGFELYLAERCNVECSRVYDASATDPWPRARGEGLGTGLEAFDCVLLLPWQMTVDGKQLRQIRDHCRGGGALVGVGGPGEILQDWSDFNKEVFGAECLGYHSNRMTEVRVAEAAKDHPVLAGVGPFSSPGGLPISRNLAADVRVLLRGESGDCSEPVAWTRTYGGGRVFHTSLGRPGDFRRRAFLRLLANALYWAVRGLGV